MAGAKKILSVIGRLILMIVCVLGVFQLISLANYVVKTGWSSVPFGVAGFVLGVLILVVTTLASYWDSKELNTSFSLTDIQQFGFFRTLGYFYGAVAILSSVLWFITPSNVLQSLPSFTAMIPYYLLAPIFLHVGGMLFAAGILHLREKLLTALFWLAMGFVLLGVVNASLWNISENLTGDYYLFGKAFFVFLFILQVIYLVAIHILPVLGQDRRLPIDS